MNMNMSAIMPLMGTQMTPIADALTSQPQGSGFMDLIQSLMSSGSSSLESEESEVSTAYLSFLKQSKEIDMTKVDASWLQSMLAAIRPLVENADLSQEEVSALLQGLNQLNGNVEMFDLNQSVTNEGIYTNIYLNGNDNSNGVGQAAGVIGNSINEGMNGAEDIVSNLVNTTSTAHDVIQQFLIEHGVKEEVVVNVMKQLQGVDDQAVQSNKTGLEANGIVSQPSYHGEMEVVKLELPQEPLYAMQISRPVVKEISLEELYVVKQHLGVEQNVETSDLPEQDVAAVGVLPMPIQVQGNEFVLRDEASVVLPDDVIDQVQQKIVSSLNESKDEFVMQLRPEGLGEITVKMVMSEGGKIVVNIHTQSQEARQILSQEMNQLKEVLRPYNTEVGEISSQVSNDGYFQQSGYQHSNHSQQSQFGRPVRFGYDAFPKEDSGQSGNERQIDLPLQRGRLYTYA